MFTRKLDQILIAGAGTTSYDIEQYYVFVSLLFSVCAYPSVVSYLICIRYIVCILHIECKVFRN